MLTHITLRENLLFSSLTFDCQRGNLIDMDVNIIIDLRDYKVTFWSHNPRAIWQYLKSLLQTQELILQFTGETQNSQ